MRDTKQSRLSLTIFLLKDQEAANAAEAALLSGEDVVGLVEPLVGKFGPVPAPERVPAWSDAVRPLLSGDPGVPPARSPAAVMTVHQDGRTFLITFAHAWQKLKDEWLEPEFGRKVVLNSIARNQLVEIRAEQVFAKWHLASERAPRAASVDEFGVEFDRDLVAVVEGTPSDDSLGRTIRGGTSLRASFPISTLSANLTKAGALFISTSYKKTWPEIDNLQPVRDGALIAQLETQLDSELSSGKAFKSLVMFTPSLRRGEGVTADSYVLGKLSKSPASIPYLEIGFWVNHLKRSGQAPSVAAARRTKLHMLDYSKESLGDSDVFSTFGYELALNGNQYVLSSGVWYQVALNFIAKTNKLIGEMPAPNSMPLPWNQTESEAEYNTRVAKKLRCLHFDAKNLVYGGGQSKFEFCDFMHEKSKTLYFAKIVSKSSGMSHLTEQVRRTAELLFSADPTYRRKLARNVVKLHPKADPSWLDSRPAHGDYELCFVSLGRTAKQLPFFARCGLAKTFEDLRERGHPVTFAAV